MIHDNCRPLWETAFLFLQIILQYIYGNGLLSGSVDYIIAYVIINVWDVEEKQKNMIVL